MYKLDRYTYITSHIAKENPFLKQKADFTKPPKFSSTKKLLPAPYWDGHESTAKCYWKAWELAFGNLRTPTRQNGFVSPYSDTAFNDHLFMWDSSFILMFGKYGMRAFNFLGTLDNFYAKQHPDGFICREIDTKTGNDVFHRHDPVSTGPDIMGWTEVEYYRLFGDRARLARVYPALLAYHQWLRRYRAWPDGSHWTSGWGSGIDNQPRQDLRGADIRTQGDLMRHRCFSHGHMSWVDATMQAVLSARSLATMATVLGDLAQAKALHAEARALSAYVNGNMWGERAGFYFDRYADKKLSGVTSIAAYWALLAGIVPKNRLARFVSHLSDEKEFNRPHRVPTLAANQKSYCPTGDYWNGSVWPPTNYMALRGLSKCGQEALAHEIALNHLENVVRVFERTGTLWENYAPERPAPGKPAKPDFVGWSGLGPISVMLEYVFGIRPEASRGTVLWDIRLIEGHGVANYPFGRNGTIELRCAPRTKAGDEPRIEAESTVPVKLEVRWAGGKRRMNMRAG